MAHIYEVGTRAWQPDPTEGWLASEVKEKLVDGEKVQLVFELENGEVRVLDAVVSMMRSHFYQILARASRLILS